MPTQAFLQHLYSTGSESVVPDGWGAEAKPNLTSPEQWVVDIESVRDPGSYFELGVGKGLLYSEFQNRGWVCKGVDPGSWSTRFSGIYGSLESVPRDARFDVIVALDVLEHLENPLMVLRQLRAMAHVGSRIYCAFPNCHSLRAWKDGGRWRMVRPLGHVHYWSPRSVRVMFAKAGFSISLARRTDLWSGRVRGLRSFAKMIVERVHLGDQWFIGASATNADGAMAPSGR